MSKHLYPGRNPSLTHSRGAEGSQTKRNAAGYFAGLASIGASGVGIIAGAVGVALCKRCIEETRYDLDFGRRGRPVLHNSRYAACDVVDIHSGVRRALREPRADQGTIALDNKGLLGGNLETKA
jgi:hypothetical protein